MEDIPDQHEPRAGRGRREIEKGRRKAPHKLNMIRTSRGTGKTTGCGPGRGQSQSTGLRGKFQTYRDC
jgi:hypothetical protein